MDQQIKKLIEQLEIELLQPKIRKSKERLNELLADNFFEFGMSGDKYTKQDILNILPQSKGIRYEGTDFESVEISPNTILLTYRASVENTNTNKKIWTLRSSIWQKRNDNWQMIFHQGTPQK